MDATEGNSAYLATDGGSERLPVLKPLDFWEGYTCHARLQPTTLSEKDMCFLGPLDEHGIFGDFEADALPGLTVLVGRHGFVPAHIPIQHSEKRVTLQ